VAQVETRVVEDVMLPIPGMPRPAYGKLLSVPGNRPPTLNVLALRSGRMPERGREDEVVVLDAFARAQGLQPGHRLPAVIHGKVRQLRVVGTALSPEFVYGIRPGSLADDPTRYAVLWMERAVLAAAFQLEGAFNDVSLVLQPGASELAVLADLDRLLRPYGATGPCHVEISRRTRFSPASSRSCRRWRAWFRWCSWAWRPSC
jgi:putative ABC transport system permease protein